MLSPKITLNRLGFSSGAAPVFDWAAWWASRISVTVENAAPSNVVLTFPSAQATVAADITCTVNGANRAVSLESWTGAVWTVVLSSAVVFGDIVVMTFVPTGGTANVTNNVNVVPQFSVAPSGLSWNWNEGGVIKDIAVTIIPDAVISAAVINGAYFAVYAINQTTNTVRIICSQNNNDVFDYIDTVKITTNQGFRNVALIQNLQP